MELIKSFLTNNPCYQANVNRADSRYSVFQDRGPLGLMLHSVGCAQPSAAVFVKKWNRADYTNACVHAFIDGGTGAVYQTLPWNFRGWHGGGSSNNTHVGVEMCEPDCLVYGPGGTFTVTDPARAKACVRRTYASAVALFALLCRQYSLNPAADILSHAEGGKQGIATKHADPEHLWRGVGLDYTMDGFRSDVAAAMAAEQQPAAPAEEVEALQQAVAALTARLDRDLGPWIQRIEDVPHDSVRAQTRELLDLGVLNAGTADDPDDVRLPYNVLRALVMAKRCAEMVRSRDGCGA